MVGPLVYDLAKQHISELLAEREGDRLAAQALRVGKENPLKLDFRKFFMAPPTWRSGAAQS